MSRVFTEQEYLPCFCICLRWRALAGLPLPIGGGAGLAQHRYHCKTIVFDSVDHGTSAPFPPIVAHNVRDQTKLGIQPCTRLQRGQGHTWCVRRFVRMLAAMCACLGVVRCLLRAEDTTAAFRHRIRPQARPQSKDMPPKAKRSMVSCEAQVAALQRRAQKVKQRESLAILIAALAVHPELSTSALEHVLTISGDSKEEILRKDAELKKKRKRGEDDDGTRMMVVSPLPSPPNEFDTLGQNTLHGGPVDDAWLQKADTLMNCTVGTLTTILGWIEPASMSPHALKASIPPGKRAIPKQSLLELIE